MCVRVQKILLSLIAAVALSGPIALASALHTEDQTQLDISRIIDHKVASIADAMGPLTDYTRRLHATIKSHLVVEITKPGRWCTHLHVTAEQQNGNAPVDSGRADCTVAAIDKNPIADVIQFADVIDIPDVIGPPSALAALSEQVPQENQLMESKKSQDSYHLVEVHRLKTHARNQKGEHTATESDNRLATVIESNDYRVNNAITSAASSTSTIGSTSVSYTHLRAHETLR